jgi:hypothetical protein
MKRIDLANDSTPSTSNKIVTNEDIPNMGMLDGYI